MAYLIFGLFLSTAICSGLLAAEQFTISRFPQQNGDRFEIPNSACEGITSVSKCQEYDAVQNGSLCNCQCPSTRASLLYNGTKWKCTDDKNSRTREKCAVVVGLESKSDQLSVLGPSLSRLWNINTLYGSNRSCDIHVGSSRYLDCFGTWRPFNSTGSFAIFKGLGSDMSLRIFPEMLIIYEGRIMRLDFTSGCTINGNGAPCLLFKLKGNTTCPVEVLSNSLSTTTTTTKTTAVTPTVTVIGNTLEAVTTVYKEETTNPARNSPLPVGKGNTKADEHAHYVLIVAIVSTFALLFFFVILGILTFTLCRRHRRTKCVLYRRRRTRPSKIKVTQERDDIIVLPNIEANENVSDYAELGEHQLSFLNLGFLSLCQLDGDVPFGTKDHGFPLTHSSDDTIHGNVVCFSNPVALDCPEKKTELGSGCNGISTCSDTETKVCVDAVINLLEKDLTTNSKDNIFLSPPGDRKRGTKLADTINKEEIALPRPSAYMNNARADMSISLESIGSGYDNRTLCGDLHDVDVQTGLQNDPKNDIKSLEKGGNCVEGEASSESSDDPSFTEKPQSNSLLEDIIKDLQDRAVK